MLFDRSTNLAFSLSLSSSMCFASCTICKPKESDSLQVLESGVMWLQLNKGSLQNLYRIDRGKMGFTCINTFCLAVRDCIHRACKVVDFCWGLTSFISASGLSSLSPLLLTTSAIVLSLCLRALSSSLTMASFGEVNASWTCIKNVASNRK